MNRGPVIPLDQSQGPGSAGASTARRTRYRLLVLSDFSILPPDHGGKIRIYQTYSRLAEWFEVTYVCLWAGQETRVDVLGPHFRQVRVPQGRLMSRAQAALGSRVGAPVGDITAGLFCRANVRLRYTVFRRSRDADAVVLALPYLRPVVPHAVPILYDSQNVEYHLKQEILGNGRWGRLLLAVVHLLESSTCRRASAIFAVAPTDGRAFAGIYGVEPERIHLAPNGADVGAFLTLQHEPAPEDPPIGVFVGSGHPPNVDAALEIIERIAPALPEMRFVLAGTVCDLLGDRQISANVQLVSYITEPEKTALYRRATVALNPMKRGSGTNLKMLEYLAAGIPVVTTAIGARGLDLDSSTAEVCPASEFPDALRALVSDAARRDRLRANGMRHVAERFDWQRIAAGMADVVSHVVSDARACRWFYRALRAHCGRPSSPTEH